MKASVMMKWLESVHPDHELEVTTENDPEWSKITDVQAVKRMGRTWTPETIDEFAQNYGGVLAPEKNGVYEQTRPGPAPTFGKLAARDLEEEMIDE